MKLKDKVAIARELAVWQLQEMHYETVLTHELTKDLSEELQDDIHDIITNALVAEVRGK